MTLLVLDDSTTKRTRSPFALEEVDLVLGVQFIVGWAGEGGEEPRLGWWRTDLASEYGGVDLYKTLLPSTWEWAVLESVREAARRTDAAGRSKDHNPDRLLTIFNLGFDVDERIEERLRELKGSGKSPEESLPLLTICDDPWNRTKFEEWLRAQGNASFTPAPAGRRLVGEPPASVKSLVTALLAALLPLTPEYPLPHFRRAV
jgi:hypothetical protein